jgi:hypothetical protein
MPPIPIIGLGLYVGMEDENCDVKFDSHRDGLSIIPRCTKNGPKRVHHYRLSRNHRLDRSDN